MSEIHLVVDTAGNLGEVSPAQPGMGKGVITNLHDDLYQRWRTVRDAGQNAVAQADEVIASLSAGQQLRLAVTPLDQIRSHEAIVFKDGDHQITVENHILLASLLEVLTPAQRAHAIQAAINKAQRYQPGQWLAVNMLRVVPGGNGR